MQVETYQNRAYTLTEHYYAEPGKRNRSKLKGDLSLLINETDGLRVLEQFSGASPPLLSPKIADTPKSAAEQKSLGLAMKSFSFSSMKKWGATRETPCWEILSKAAEYYTLPEGWQHYELHIRYNEPWSTLDRVLGLEERPLDMWTETRSDGHVPKWFSLKKRTVPYVHDRSNLLPPPKTA
jgi:hypothetical protein